MSQHNNNSRKRQDITDLRRRREQLGLTRPQLAVRARCSLTTLVNIETGVTRRGVSVRRVHQVLAELEEAA